MELKTFVSETIKEIMEGVADAQKHIIEGVPKTDSGVIQIGSQSFESIEFDVSVTSSDTQGTEGKAGVSIKIVDFGVKGNTLNQNSTTNRIRFKVPVIFPEKSTYRRL